MLDCTPVHADKAVRILLVAGLLLAAVLFFAPWYEQAFVLGPIVFTRTALEPPHGWLAVLAWLLTVSLLAEVILSRLSYQGLPDVPIPWARIQMAQGGAIFVCVGLKFAASIGHLVWGGFLGILLAGAVLYASWAANHHHGSIRRVIKERRAS